ncbi:MAG: hypothetical protein S0880_11925 [Actinomycetota bacterium]|nr:hypothetical protein [Actinomycetota bacterium]
MSLIPSRLAAGGFLLNSGLEKWKGDEQTAQALHGFATSVYPFLGSMGPARFLKLLAGAEIAIGTMVVVPFFPKRLAGWALTAFTGGLLGVYFRTPGMRQEDGIRPTQEGLSIAKDVWLLGIGLSLVAAGKKKKSKDEPADAADDELAND